jgi:hypothetical protein
MRLCVVGADADDAFRTRVVDALGRAARVRLIAEIADADRAVLIASRAAATDPVVDAALASAGDLCNSDALALVLVDGYIEWGPQGLDTDALPMSVRRHFTRAPLYIDARREPEIAIDRLAHAVGAPPEGAEEPQAVPLGASIALPNRASRAPARGSRRAWLLVGAVALIAIVVAVAIAFDVASDGGESGPTLGTPDTSGGVDGGPSTVTGSPPESSTGGIDAVVVALFFVGGVAVAVIVGFTMYRYGLRRRDRGVPDPSAIAMRTRDTPSGAARPRGRSEVRAGEKWAGLVFISHDTDADGQLAHQLAIDLRERCDVWIAPDSIGPGDEWLFAMDAGLRKSKVFVLLLSRAALDSAWVRKEIQAALMLEVETASPHIIPIELEPCDAPVLLRGYQMLHMKRGYEAVTRQLGAVLVQMAGTDQ